MAKKLASAVFSALLIMASASAFEPAGCFPKDGGYYDFMNGVRWLDFHTERPVYQTGEEMEINYRLGSVMEAPIVDGLARVQIFYNDSWQGEQIVDEFVSDGGLYLRKGDVLRKEVRWKIPKHAKAGTYMAKIYLLAGKGFNLGGISFLAYGQGSGTGVPGMLTNFMVENAGMQSRIYFDKTATKINGEAYQFAVPAPSIDEGKAVILSSWLVNEGDPKTVEVNLEVYKWDDINNQPMSQYNVSKKLSLSKNGKTEVQMAIPAGLKPDTYQVRFWARSGEETGLMKLRFSVPGELSRLNYAGLSGYPLKAGREYAAFVCASNAAGELMASAEGTITARLVDGKGETIFEDSSNHTIPKQPAGFLKKFTPARDISDARLTVDIKDKGGEVVDSAELDYDLSKFQLPDARLDLKIASDVLGKDDALSYSIDFHSGTYPLSGSLLVYVLDSDGKVALMKDTARIEGRQTGEIKAAFKPGRYRLVARETTQDRIAQTDFTVKAQASPDAYRPPEPGGSGMNLIFMAIFALAAIAAVYMIKRERGKD
ncbi:MAG: hypothetical protein HYX24_00695 [Candidatus Aenigmarchaeota archaeon]|nr:hypothetical protein [Candidatus Aenigmarchaeota archaeon]